MGTWGGISEKDEVGEESQEGSTKESPEIPLEGNQQILSIMSPKCSAICCSATTNGEVPPVKPSFKYVTGAVNDLPAAYWSRTSCNQMYSPPGVRTSFTGDETRVSKMADLFLDE
jgi:hypothetical protein